KVTLGTIDNTSLGGTGYSDFTSITTDITIGSSNTITITPTWTSGSYPEGYAVWIDLNGDSDFDDEDELVWSKTPSTAATVSGSFTLSNAATNGTTRMRVSMKYDGVPSSCGAFSYGEVEDYSVNIVGGLPAPIDLQATETTSSSTVLSWTAPEDATDVAGYNVYQVLSEQATGSISESGYMGTTTATNYTVTELTSSTDYTFIVKAKDNAENLSKASNAVTVTTQAAPTTYCESSDYTNMPEFGISKVELGSINNSSGFNSYSDFTDITTNITKGSQNMIMITKYNNYGLLWGYAVWIDLNGDLDFEDAGELVWSKEPSNETLNPGAFTVPFSEFTGTTRMRVSMKYNAIPTSCGDAKHGEVEDYSVNIVAGDAPLAKTSIEKLGNEKLTSNLYLYPNPADNILNVSLADYINTTYKIINLLGQQVGTGKLSESAIDINALEAGVYILEINNGQKTHFKKFVKN
ncbi:MAG: bacillolysin, partial [Candidatus Azotimanducaceae bacterium]